MGISNKKKFEINSKDDAILYLGHLIEYFQKVKLLFENFHLKSLQHIGLTLFKNDYDIDGDISTIEFLLKNDNVDLEFDFYEFKLYQSAIEENKRKLLNIIGDFSKDKRAVSYNNYISIMRTLSKKNINKNIPLLTINKERDELIKEFQLMRNYTHHFTADKLCEWISIRENQLKEYGDKCSGFNTGKSFNIFISPTISYELYRNEFIKNMSISNIVKEIEKFLIKDFEILIGEKIEMNIHKERTNGIDGINWCEEISYNGYLSHIISNEN